MTTRPTLRYWLFVLWTALLLVVTVVRFTAAQDAKPDPAPDPRIALLRCQAQTEDVNSARATATSALKQLQAQLLEAGLLNDKGLLDVAAHDAALKSAASK